MILVECGTCKWWRTFGNRADARERPSNRDDYAQCKANPPIVLPNGTLGWPTVGRKDWCGRHTPR